MISYDYAHRDGVLPVSWQDFAALTRRLAEGLAAENVSCVVGVARAGLFPATAVACALRCDLVPVRVTRREQDRVVHPSPVWKTPVSDDVRGRVVAVVDEIDDTGETLRLVTEHVMRQRASRVVTAALVTHSWATPMPNIVALTSDALVLFPWDREVLANGSWEPHPELEEAFAAQKQRS